MDLFIARLDPSDSKISKTPRVLSLRLYIHFEVAAAVLLDRTRLHYSLWSIGHSDTDHSDRQMKLITWLIFDGNLISIKGIFRIPHF